MIWLWSVAAWACGCTSQPATLSLPTDAHRDGPIRVFMRGRWPGDAAEQAVSLLRLRGPDGELVPLRVEALGPRLDLLPEDPLAAGRYVFEQHLTYADGALVPLLVEPEGRDIDRAWFAVGELQVVDESSPPATPPAVEWQREHIASSCGPGSVLRTRLSWPGASWIEVEVQGRGVVGTVPGYQDGFFVYVSDDSCNAWKVGLPPEEALNVRPVAVALDGSRTPGAWTELPSVGPAHDRLAGVPKRQRLKVPHSDGTAFEGTDRCGLQMQSRQVIEPDLPRVHEIVWTDGGLRRLWGVEGGVMLDGERIALPEASGIPQGLVVAAAGPRVYALYTRESELALLALEGSQLLWSRPLGTQGTPTSLEVQGAEIVLRWEERALRLHKVHRQRFSSEGEALGAAELDLEQTRLDPNMGQLTWLGERVAVGAGRMDSRVSRLDGVDYVLSSASEGGTWLAAVRAGEILWQEKLGDTRTIPEPLRLDSQGIEVRWRENHRESQEERSAWFSYEGEPVPPFTSAHDPPAPRQSVPLAGGEVRLRQLFPAPMALSFAEGPHEGPVRSLEPSSPPRVHASEVLLRAQGDVLEVAIVAGSELRIETWTCSGQRTLGIPQRWSSP